MTSVLTSPPRDDVGRTTLIPFALWTDHGHDHAELGRLLAQAELPNLSAWLQTAQRVAVQADAVTASGRASLSPPHERAWAQIMGWPVVDGGLPWAARAALERGLARPQAAVDVSAAGWAFITWCNWQVGQGQVRLGEPAHLHIDAATDAALLQAVHHFFAEDGIALHPYKPGQWLAQSPWFVDLPTASLDRVIGCNVDPWLVGGEAAAAAALSPAAQQLRRLQNEMQMLLYTHPLNEGRSLSINSFWLHGTGTLPASQPTGPAPVVVDTLRESALQQDLHGWLAGWQHVDAHVIAPLRARVAVEQPQRLVLCGEHTLHVYDSTAPTLWQRLRRRLVPISLDTVLTVAPHPSTSTSLTRAR